jgi:hypothetical protein
MEILLGEAACGYLQSPQRGVRERTIGLRSRGVVQNLRRAEKSDYCLAV